MTLWDPDPREPFHERYCSFCGCPESAHVVEEDGQYCVGKQGHCKCPYKGGEYS